eukprot:5356471-Prymnesium_polylepis.1
MVMRDPQLIRDRAGRGTARCTMRAFASCDSDATTSRSLQRRADISRLCDLPRPDLKFRPRE